MFKLFGGGNKETKPGKRIELDVREQLRNKQEPFQLIMDTVKTVGKEDVFILHATFKPTPLLGLMKVKGFTNEVEQLEKDHWVVTFRHKSYKAEGDQTSAESGAAGAAGADGRVCCESRRACRRQRQRRSDGTGFLSARNGLRVGQPRPGAAESDDSHAQQAG